MEKHIYKPEIEYLLHFKSPRTILEFACPHCTEIVRVVVHRISKKLYAWYPENPGTPSELEIFKEQIKKGEHP